MPLDRATPDDYVLCHLCGHETSLAMIAVHLEREHGIDPAEFESASVIFGYGYEQIRGEGPDCVVNHWLAVSGGHEICWCDPEVEPGIMGCVIRHQDKRYEDVMALQREMEDDEGESLLER